MHWPTLFSYMTTKSGAVAGNPGSLGGHVVTQDGSGRSRQGHRHLVTTLAHDPSKPEVRGHISYVQRRHFTASKPSIGHGGKNRALPETTQP